MRREELEDALARATFHGHVEGALRVLRRRARSGRGSASRDEELLARAVRERDAAAVARLARRILIGW